MFKYAYAVLASALIAFSLPAFATQTVVGGKLVVDGGLKIAVPTSMWPHVGKDYSGPNAGLEQVVNVFFDTNTKPQMALYRVKNDDVRLGSVQSWAEHYDVEDLVGFEAGKGWKEKYEADGSQRKTSQMKTSIGLVDRLDVAYKPKNPKDAEIYLSVLYFTNPAKTCRYAMIFFVGGKNPAKDSTTFNPVIDIAAQTLSW